MTTISLTKRTGTATVTRHPPGKRATNLHVGDFLLTGLTQQGLISRAIKLGSWLRGYERPYQRFSHAALVISTDGTLAEALANGVRRNPISKYDQADYRIVHTHVDGQDQAEILEFANSVLKSHEAYGYSTFAGLAVYCLTGAQLCVQDAGTAICSGFVCDALTRAGFIWERPPFAMMPAD
ncbi:MAG: hypothetical protein ACXVSL_07140, partial [Solirubrobacteraceae bacterium]